jgi:nitroreductase
MPDLIVRLLRELRAVRRFAPRTVPDGVVRDLLEVARWTGSGRNRQPWELILVREPATLKALADAGASPGTRHLAAAPLAVLLVMAGPGTEFDEGRLAERIMLAAAAHGLGSSIAGFRGADPVHAARELLGVPPERVLRTAVCVGYPDEHGASDPAVAGALPRGRKPLAEFVHFERYGRRDD